MRSIPGREVRETGSRRLGPSATAHAGDQRGRALDPSTPLIIVAMMLALGISSLVDAKIVSFTDGRILKAEDAFLEGDEIVIRLRGGGTIHVPATRVERVVADEVETAAEPLPAPGTCRWRWSPEPLPEGMPYGEEIWAAARAAGIHPWLLVQLVRAESNFDPLAVSRAGASGLTQLMPSTALAENVTDVYDPAENLAAGARYLRSMLDRFGSLNLALAAYNAGPTAVERHDGVPPYRETRDYVRKITKWFCDDPSDD